MMGMASGSRPRLEARRQFTSGSNVHNNQKAQPGTEVTIVHATHPYHGQKVRVVPRMGRRQTTGEIRVALPTGEKRTIPVAWTDQGEQEEYPDGVYFPVRNL